MTRILTTEAELRLKRAIADRISIGTAGSKAEFLEGPDGPFLHIKVLVWGHVDSKTRADLTRAATEAAMATLPDLAHFPLVTVVPHYVEAGSLTRMIILLVDNTPIQVFYDSDSGRSKALGAFQSYGQPLAATIDSWACEGMLACKPSHADLTVELHRIHVKT